MLCEMGKAIEKRFAPLWKSSTILVGIHLSYSVDDSSGAWNMSTLNWIKNTKGIFPKTLAATNLASTRSTSWVGKNNISRWPRRRRRGLASGLYQITPWLVKMYFWSNSGYFQVESEQLIYPWQSLLAEFGGVLGLFLGFSFMTIWESVVSLKHFKLPILCTHITL